MAHLRPAFLIPVLAFVLLAGIFAANLYQVGIEGRQTSDLPSALVGKPAPQFDLPPAIPGGRGFATADLEGGASLVNVWASWCPPCRTEHPVLMALAERGVTIWGINYKDKTEDARRFLDELGNPFRAIGADRNGRAAIDWGVYGYPETFVVDAAGRVRYHHVGPILPGDVESRIMPKLREATR